MALYYIAAGVELSMIVPTLVLYAVAGYRLMPSVGKLANALSQLRQFQPVIGNISRVLSASTATAEPAHSCKPIASCATIQFQEVTFKYPSAKQPLFKSLELAINGSSFVCLVGKSGSGKTTAVDLLLGLLPADAGKILVNGKSIDEVGECDWRTMFGYVPQAVYIVDGTIAENIAFGIPPADVDQEQLRRVVAMCHLEDFVDAQPEGLNAPVGERGSKLSGGQRQRLGIARALYRDPSILILDESTNSLDGLSERAIIETLLSLKKSKAIISIAHRGALARYSDRIILIDQGRIIADGTYENLSSTSPLFASMMSEMEIRKQ